MPELSPLPSRQSPEQHFSSTHAAKGFFSKWGGKIAASSFTLASVIEGLNGVSNLVYGDTTHGLLPIISSAILGATAGMTIIADKRRSKNM